MTGPFNHAPSTLPEEAFDHFPRRGASEIHLATGFQNLIYDHPRFPVDLRRRIYEHLGRACADERKAGETDEQFLYKTRKKGFGPFKREFWDLDASLGGALGTDLEARFALLMRKLNVIGTRAVVDRTVRIPAPPVDEAPKGLTG
jgi:hypothetical protein